MNDFSKDMPDALMKLLEDVDDDMRFAQVKLMEATDEEYGKGTGVCVAMLMIFFALLLKQNVGAARMAMQMFQEAMKGDNEKLN